jgi:hypothetical protein
MKDVVKREGRLGPFQAVGALLSLFLAYCVIAIILRYAFDIELNPFP